MDGAVRSRDCKRMGPARGDPKPLWAIAGDSAAKALASPAADEAVAIAEMAAVPLLIMWSATSPPTAVAVPTCRKPPVAALFTIALTVPLPLASTPELQVSPVRQIVSVSSTFADVME
jgi:hypothetical protein